MRIIGGFEKNFQKELFGKFKSIIDSSLALLIIVRELRDFKHLHKIGQGLNTNMGIMQITVMYLQDSNV